MEPTRLFPFRRALAINPVIIPVVHLTAGSAVQIDQNAIKSAGVTSFKLYNPSPYWVWYRGWTGLQSDMPAIKELGHCIPPGAVDINTSQIPQWIAAVAQAEPGFPAAADGAGLLTTPGRLVMIYGSGM